MDNRPHDELIKALELSLCLRDFFTPNGYAGDEIYKELHSNSENERRGEIYLAELSDMLFNDDYRLEEYNVERFEEYELKAYSLLFGIEYEAGRLELEIWEEIAKELSLFFIRNSNQYKKIEICRGKAKKDGSSPLTATVPDKCRMLFSHISCVMNVNKNNTRYVNSTIYKMLTQEGEPYSDGVVRASFSRIDIGEVNMSTLPAHLSKRLKANPFTPEQHAMYRRWAWQYANLNRAWKSISEAFKPSKQKGG